MRGKRLIQVASVGLSALAAVTCVETNTSRCPDGSICAENLTCVVVDVVGSQRPYCVTAGELDACANGSDGSCQVDGAAGTCHGGACFPSICGDGLLDVTEICDDGNLLDGDDCSALCTSIEICGNGVVDLVRGEQCDDARTKLTGDGCSSTCLSEYRVWRDVTPSPPFTRLGYSFAPDPLEGLVLFGGALSNGNVGLNVGSNAPLTIDETWRWTGLTWLPIPTLTTPPRRLRAAIAYDPMRKRVVMFGGMDGSSTRLDDTWEWDGVDWMKRTPPTSPPARADASLACGPSGCVLVGGTGPYNLGATFRADSWLWNGTTWRQLTGAAPTPSRGRAAHAYDTERGRHVLFGGEGGGSQSEFYADTWELVDGAEGWSLTTATGPPVPTIASPATAAFDDVTNRTVLISGGQTWLFDGAWTNAGVGMTAVNPNLAFDPRRGRTTTLGMTMQGGPLLGFDFNTSSVGWALAGELRPGQLSMDVIATYDARRGRSIVLDATGTYEWNGTAYRRLTTGAVGPQTRYGLAMAHDARCGITLAFGGASAAFNAPTNRTWIYAAGGWTEHTTGPRPTALLNHAMVYDEAHDAIVMFGGRIGSPPSVALVDELWVWTGADCATRSWQQISASSSPGWPNARGSTALAYDAARGKVVLFGGVDMQGNRFDDTWELEGSTWTRATAAAPRGRFDHGLAYDPRRRTVILFGGLGSDGILNDTWEWDGVAWRELATVIAPAPRANHALTRDVTGAVLSFGGQNVFGGLLSDVPRLRSELSLEPLERCLVDSADDDGDGLEGCADPDCWGRCAPSCPYGTSCPGPACGDSVCSALEDYLLCPVDCPRL